MEDTPDEIILTQSDQLHIVPTSTDEVRMPTEKVGCILVTSRLKQFLENYPLSSEKQASLDVYHMLSLFNICTTIQNNILTVCHLIMNT